MPTGPETVSFTQIAARLGEATGNDVVYVAVPDDAARAAMLDAGLPKWLVGMLVEYGQAHATGWGDFTTNHVEELSAVPHAPSSTLRATMSRRSAVAARARRQCG